LDIARVFGGTLGVSKKREVRGKRERKGSPLFHSYTSQRDFDDHQNSFRRSIYNLA